MATQRTRRTRALAGVTRLMLAVAVAGATTLIRVPPSLALASAEPSPSQPSGGPAPEGRIVYGRFVAQGEAELLYVLGHDHAGERMIGDPTDCGTCASVSADGEHVVTLTLAPDDRFTFVVMRSDGSDRREFPLPAGMGFGPGPFDGDDILVGGGSDKEPQANGIYRVHAAGFSGLEQLARPPEGEWYNPLIASPDGTRLAVFVPRTDNGEHGDLLLLELGSGSIRRLNPEGTRAALIPSIGVPCSFSPDSKRVTFGAYEGDQGNNADPERSAVFIADVDGGDAQRIGSLGTGTVSARWSPTADDITFQRREGGVYGVFLIRPDGTDERALAAASGGTMVSAWAPVWSPSGDWLVIQRGTHLDFDLWAIRPDGTGLRQLTSHPAGYGGVSWAP